jgi:hypothetical protein
MSMNVWDGVEVSVTIGAGLSDSPEIILSRRVVVWIETPVGLQGNRLEFLAVSPEGPRILRDVYGAALAMWYSNLSAGSRHCLFRDALSLQLAQHDAIIIRAMTGGTPQVQDAPRELRLRQRGLI